MHGNIFYECVEQVFTQCVQLLCVICKGLSFASCIESVPDATAFMLVYVKKEFVSDFCVQCQDIGLCWCTIVLFSLVQGRDESLSLGLRGCA